MTRAKLIPSPKVPRMRKCAAKGCQNRFAPRNITHKACSTDCAAIIGSMETEKKRQHAIKAERAKDTVKRESLKSLSDWVKEVQVIFNRFIRLRDTNQLYICCGRVNIKDYLTGSAWDSGHYRSTGSAPHLRFNEDNVHRQLVHCNRDRAGNAVEYRIGLIKRIGLERVEALESNHLHRKYTIDELRSLKAYYQAKIKEMKANLPRIDSGFIYFIMGDSANKPEPVEENDNDFLHYREEYEPIRNNDR